MELHRLQNCFAILKYTLKHLLAELTNHLGSNMKQQEHVLLQQKVQGDFLDHKLEGFQFYHDQNGQIFQIEYLKYVCKYVKCYLW